MNPKNSIADELAQATQDGIRDKLWLLLLEKGEHQLLEKLRLTEIQSWGTVPIPDKGFSEDDEIHNLTITWLRMQGVNVFNVKSEYLIGKHLLKDGARRRNEIY